LCFKFDVYRFESRSEQLLLSNILICLCVDFFDDLAFMDCVFFGCCTFAVWHLARNVSYHVMTWWIRLCRHFWILCNYCATMEERSREDERIHQSNSCCSFNVMIWWIRSCRHFWLSCFCGLFLFIVGFFLFCCDTDEYTDLILLISSLFYSMSRSTCMRKCGRNCNLPSGTTAWLEFLPRKHLFWNKQVMRVDTKVTNVKSDECRVTLRTRMLSLLSLDRSLLFLDRSLLFLDRSLLFLDIISSVSW